MAQIIRYYDNYKVIITSKDIALLNLKKSSIINVFLLRIEQIVQNLIKSSGIIIRFNDEFKKKNNVTIIIYLTNIAEISWNYLKGNLFLLNFCMSKHNNNVILLVCFTKKKLILWQKTFSHELMYSLPTWQKDFWLLIPTCKHTM